MRDARNHYPRIKHHTPPPKRGNNTDPNPPGDHAQACIVTPDEKHGPVVSKPNSVSDNSLDRPAIQGTSRTGASVCHVHQTPHPLQATGHPTNRPGHRNPRHMWAGPGLVVLLRKEVIQPHLPVRLPCYDFVPIADPTFDGSLPQGVRPPASGVTDFHDVTGGVYKARERIHRSVADLRLLATPTSRGRVADPDPN